MAQKKTMTETERWLVLMVPIAGFLGIAWLGSKAKKARAQNTQGLVPYDMSTVAEFNGLGAVPVGTGPLPQRWPNQPTHNTQVPPNQVHRMNMDLQRSQAYPGAPWITQGGVEQYRSNQPMPVTYLPQSMLFTTNKEPPAGYNTTPGMSGYYLVQSALQERQRLEALSQAPVRHVPIAGRAETAQALNDIPMTPYNGTYMNSHPIQRDMLVRPDVQGGDALNQVAVAFNADPTNWQGAVLDRFGPPRLNHANRMRSF